MVFTLVYSTACETHTQAHKCIKQEAWRLTNKGLTDISVVDIGIFLLPNIVMSIGPQKSHIGRALLQTGQVLLELLWIHQRDMVLTLIPGLSSPIGPLNLSVRYATSRQWAGANTLHTL